MQALIERDPSRPARPLVEAARGVEVGREGAYHPPSAGEILDLGLMALPSVRATDTFTRGLSSQDWNVRVESASALGMSEDPRAAAALICALDDPDQVVEVVPSVVEVRGGGRVSELSQTVVRAFSGAGVVVVV